MKKEWLVKQVNPVEVELEHTLPWFKKPFGDISHHWEKAKIILSKGGELWEYNSPPETWANMCGEGGYCIVHKEEVVFHFATVVN